MAEQTQRVNIFWRLREDVSQKLKDVRQELGSTRRVTQLTASELTTMAAGLAVLGAGLLRLALGAARSADTTGRLEEAGARAKEQFALLSQTIGQAVLPILVTFLDVATRILQILNLFPAPLLQVGGSLALIGGGLLATISSVAAFIGILKELNTILRVTVVLQSVVAALGGPVGVARVGVALAIGAGAAVALGAIVGSFAQGGVVPGPAGSPQLIVAHGGETISPVGRSPAGVTVVVQAGVFTGSERQARQLVDQVILPLIRENLRVRTGGKLS